jgi:hypothetical protein
VWFASLASVLVELELLWVMARIAALLLEEIEFPCATRQSAPPLAMRMFSFVYLRPALLGIYDIADASDFSKHGD